MIAYRFQPTYRTLDALFFFAVAVPHGPGLG